MRNVLIDQGQRSTDLDRVLHVVVQAAQRRVGHLLSWGFSAQHAEVQASRTMFEMQQHVFNVHLEAQRARPAQGDHQKR